MSSRPLVALGAVLLLFTSGACSDVQNQVDGVRSDVGQLAEDGAFCLSVARALATMEGSSAGAAADAAEEALAQAPDDLRDDARTLTEALRAARDGDRSAIDDDEVLAATQRLRDEARDRCDLTR